VATRKTRDQNRPHASLTRRIAGGNTCWLPVSMSHPDNLALTSGKSSESLIEAVRTSSTVPNTGLCGDCDCATRVCKAGHGNDRVWKGGKPRIRLSTLHNLWKSLRDYHIPTASTAGIFQGARAKETECKAFGLQGGCTNGAPLPPLARWQQRTSRSVRRCCAMPNQIPRQSTRTGTLGRRWMLSACT
jgi:hypothetical protein